MIMDSVALSQMTDAIVAGQAIWRLVLQLIN